MVSAELLSFCRMPIAQEVMADMSKEITGIKASTKYTAREGTASMTRWSMKGRKSLYSSNRELIRRIYKTSKY